MLTRHVNKGTGSEGTFPDSAQGSRSALFLDDSCLLSCLQGE